MLEGRSQAIERVRDEAEKYLSDKVTSLRKAEIAVDTRVALGAPADEILGVAGAAGADLIVMATHGRTGLAQVVFGGVASHVVASGRLPVLLVRPAKLK